jgi:alpha-1,2-mannosyltransferase
VISARAVGRLLVLSTPPVVAACYVVGSTSPHGWWPWAPTVADFEVYWRTGQLVWAGGDFYHADGLPWIYPPFAALLAAGLSVLPWGVATFAWTMIGVVALLAVLHRLGASGWVLSALATASVLWVTPVHQTLRMGQLGILLVAAVVLDSLPGPRLLRRRLLPEGWLTGVATAIKLTPAVVAVYHFFAGRRPVAWRALAAFVVATGLGFAALWGPSVYYWLRLGAGDSGTNDGIIYGDNQSVLALWARLVHESSMGGLWLSLLVLVLGMVAAVGMSRSGQPRLALTLAAITGLLASPISWTHHYVWVVVLAVVIWQERTLPGAYRVLAMGYAFWMAWAPYRSLPMGGNLEFHYGLWEWLLDDAGIAWGVALLAVSVLVSWGPWGRGRRWMQRELVRIRLQDRAGVSVDD